MNNIDNRIISDAVRVHFCVEEGQISYELRTRETQDKILNNFLELLGREVKTSLATVDSYELMNTAVDLAKIDKSNMERAI